jgi:hypothetical protein
MGDWASSTVASWTPFGSCDAVNCFDSALTGNFFEGALATTSTAYAGAAKKRFVKVAWWTALWVRPAIDSIVDVKSQSRKRTIGQGEKVGIVLSPLNRAK